jgi:hypothetical protein
LINEIAEVITLPAFDAKQSHSALRNHEIQLGNEEKSQLRFYIEAIASLYHNNSFHNFEHACVVLLSFLLASHSYF